LGGGGYGPHKEEIMPTKYADIMRSLGRIEGELVEIRKLNQRVRYLEIWQSWLKGGWAALAAFNAYLFRGFSGR
jgi:hypothetical protein